jgi:3-hydroxy-9,10-secoandrosta-1,3,5(10)-triene-9,17-dione monooxygenase
MTLTALATPSKDVNLVAAAEAIVPLLRDQAQQGEKDRRLTEPVVEALTSTGITRMSMPKRFGGLQADLPTQVEVFRNLARGCGSASWVSALYSVCGWWTSLFPDEVQEEVFQNPAIRVAGIVSPAGTLVPTRGGFTLNGTWPFNTGCLHAQWNVVATLRPVDGGPPIPYLALLPMSDMEILDDWHTSGMRATGSNSSRAVNVFVPDARAMPIVPLFQGEHKSKVNRGEMPYSYAVFPFLMASSLGTPIGIAQGAMESFLERLPPRKASFENPLLPAAESPRIQYAVAEAQMKIDLALLMSRDTVELVHGLGVKRQPMSLTDRVRVRAYVGHVTQLCRDAVETLLPVSGANAHYDRVPVQRYFRDEEMLCNHGVLDAGNNLQLYGRILVGLEPGTPFL